MTTEQEPITLYFWPTPNGWKISIALEEMGLPYRVERVDIGKGAQFEPAFLALSPGNKMPVITDPKGPDGAPISLFESGAILQYLAEKTGQFGGRTARERHAVNQWLMWQMGGVGPMAGQAHHFLKYAPLMDPPQDLPYAKTRYRNEVARLYGVLDRQLATQEWVAGAEMTIADMALWPWVSLWEGQQQDLSDKPHLVRWLDTMAARPGVQAGRALLAELRKTPDAASTQKNAMFEKS